MISIHSVYRNFFRVAFVTSGLSGQLTLEQGCQIQHSIDCISGAVDTGSDLLLGIDEAVNAKNFLMMFSNYHPPATLSGDNQVIKWYFWIQYATTIIVRRFFTMLDNHHSNFARGGVFSRKQKVLLFSLSFILGAILCILFYFYKQEENKQIAYLETLDKQMKQEKRVIEDQIDTVCVSIEAIMDMCIPGIVCWGDSLTAGTGGAESTYPLILQSLISQNVLAAFDTEKMVEKLGGNPDAIVMSQYQLKEVDVINMGVGGEDTNTILGRNGAIPFVVAEDFIIPENTEAVEINFISQNGKAVAPLRQGNRGMESVTIEGIEGVIQIKQDSYTGSEYEYFFQRNTSGEAMEVKAGTEIITSASTQYLNYIPVIFIGQNGGYGSIQELIDQQRAIINHQEMNVQNYGKFIIVGLHTGTAEARAELEEVMIEEYGEQYINLREYMSTDALTDAGLEATAEDEELMAIGSTPQSLLSDEVHFNATGYRLLGEQIYQRMEELGYFDEIREEIEKNCE